MHILLTTYGLLLIFTLYAASQWRSATDMAFMDIVSTDVFSLSRSRALDELNDHSLDIYKKISGKEKQKTRSIAKIDSTKQADTNALITDDRDDEEPLIIREKPEKTEKTPKKSHPGQPNLSSFLHIGELFTSDELTIHEGKGKAIFTLMKNMMSVMYGEEKFFKEAKKADPEFEEHFILNLYERAKDSNKNLGRTKDLGTINLDDELQNYVRYKMFKGTKSRLTLGNEEESGYYSFLEFTQMSKKPTILSLWLAPKPILMALFQKPEIVDELLQVRRDAYYDLKNGKTTATAITQDLRLRFSIHIQNQGIDPNLIDFNASKTLAHSTPKIKK